jgi:hypothetical protein
MSRAWYLTIVVPLAVCVLGVFAFIRLVDNIEGMQRFVIPGERTLTLERGEHKIFAESESHVDGVAYSNERFAVRCSAEADGKPLELRTVTGKIKYSLGGYSGRAMFAFTMPAAGAARIACTTEDGKAVLAVGTGIGVSIVAAVLTLVLGILGTIGAFVIVFVLRRRRLKRKATS